MPPPRWMKPLVILLIILGGLLPVVLYWWLLGRVPTLTAQDALEILNRPGENVILVDVRDAKAFEARHLEGAQNWPFEHIVAIPSRDQVPAQFQDKTLLLICERGFSSASAARRLQTLGVGDVYNVLGGLQAWVAAWVTPCTTQFCKFVPSFDQTEDLSLRTMASYEQWAAVIAAFVFKPLYMLLSFVLILILRRQNSSDLVALRWALVFFLVGEGFCAINYIFFQETFCLFEYLHSYGMVAAFGFTGYAVMEGLDARVFRLSNPGKKCTALELCGPCIKYEDVPCGARRLFLLLAALFGILTVSPLLATPNNVSYNTYIVGTLYNYSHLVIHQIFEIRYCPILALVLVSISFVFLLLKTDRPVPAISKVLFAAGIGAWGFSMFRLVLNVVYQDNLVWSTFWEELTELLYVAAIGWVLWIFRHRLFQGNVQSSRFVIRT